MIKAGIIGGAGYTAGELIRLLLLYLRSAGTEPPRYLYGKARSQSRLFCNLHPARFTSACQESDADG